MRPLMTSSGSAQEENRRLSRSWSPVSLANRRPLLQDEANFLLIIALHWEEPTSASLLGPSP